MTTDCRYRAQVAADRRAAARERASARIAADNARIQDMYTDGYALRRARRNLPTDMVVYPDLDFKRGGRA